MKEEVNPDALGSLRGRLLSAASAGDLQTAPHGSFPSDHDCAVELAPRTEEHLAEGVTRGRGYPSVPHPRSSGVGSGPFSG